MVIIFGPAGSGKSLQGQILSARLGWRWLSAGQLLRDLKDHEISKVQHSGALVDSDIVNKLIAKAIKKSREDTGQVILDGYPREISQAEWLVEQGYPISLAVVLDVPKTELLKRLYIRGRADDLSREAIEERLGVFDRDFRTIRQILTDSQIPVVDVNGVGTVGEVHDRIIEEFEKCNII